MSEDLFSLPMQLDGITRTRRKSLALVPDSYVITRINERGKTYKQVRLNDDQHELAKSTIRTIHAHADFFKLLLDNESPLYGSELHRKSTYGEAIEGMLAKSQRRAPREVPGRIGEDYSVKQLNVLNDLVDRINALCELEQLPPMFQRVVIPFDSKP